MAPRKAKCGTESGYRRHRTMGEEYCEECKKAHNDYIAQYRARKAERIAAEKQRRKDAEVEVVKQTLKYSMDDIDEMADLLYLRDKMKEALERALEENPEKVSPISREIRNINVRINELVEVRDAEETEEDTDIFSLASVTPIVAAGGE